MRLVNIADARRLLREAKILSELPDHPNIVPLLDVLPPNEMESDLDTLFFVFELGQYDLKALMQSMNYLEESRVKQIMFDILNGVRFLHKAGIIH